MEMRAMRRWRLAAAVLSTGLASACDPGASGDPAAPTMDDEQMQEVDFRAATHGAASLESTPAFVHVGNLFAYAPPLLGEIDLSDIDAVRRQAVAAANARLAITFAVLGCDAELDTDDERRISARLQGCQLLLWELDADVEAVVSEVETQPCDAGECASRIIWEMDIGELKSGPVGLPKAGYVGPIDIEAPVDPTERMAWTTRPGFAIDTALGLRFDTLSTADWLVYNDEDCINLNMGARLTLDEREDELDEFIGDIVISARGVDRCPDRCAHAGEVQLSFGAGQLLRWTHDGGQTLTVQGPRGREVEITPPCAELSSDAG